MYSSNAPSAKSTTPPGLYIDSAMGPNEQQPCIAPPLSEVCKELMQKLA